MADLAIRLLKSPEEMAEVEALQRLVWPGSETDIVPTHVLLAAAHNGGLVLGAFMEGSLLGVSFGFPGFYTTADGPRSKLHSHILGVHPEWVGKGIGFSLKRAQWQMVRNQGIDCITWTYDPLLSRNAQLNISRLGAVCNIYLRSEYGEMRDKLNFGLPSDRFQVNWWVNTERVHRRLGLSSRLALTLDHYRLANSTIFEAHPDSRGVSIPRDIPHHLLGSLLLLEIPLDFSAVKLSDLPQALEWRFSTREFFETAFATGYLITDFILDGGRCFYILTQGDSILQEDEILLDF